MGERNARFLAPAFLSPVSAWLLVLGTHAVALFSFGATFWIDSRDYAALGEALRAENGLSTYYAATGRWIFSHLQPGVPIMWALLKSVPESWRWTLLAVTQHALAAASLLYAFHTLRHLWPTPIHLIILILICLLPQCQSFHGALLTESITSSMLLMAFTACINICLSPPPHGRRVALALVTMIVVTQFRSYWGLAVAGMLVVSLARNRMLFPWLGPTVGVASMTAALAFPAYRFACTGEFFLPQGGLNLMVSGMNVDVTPSPGAVAAIRNLPWPSNLEASQVLEKGIDAYQCMDLGNYWRSLGMDNKAIVSEGERIGTILRDDGLKVQWRRGTYGLCSIGSIGALALGDPREDVFRGMGLRRMLSHQMHYYRWHGWIARIDYHAAFETFFGPSSKPVDVPFQQQAKAGIYAAWKPYLSSCSTFLRDPLLLGRIPPDAWLAVGLTGCWVLLRRAPIIPVLLLVLVSTGFLTAAWFPLGNTRYANPLLAIYLVTASIGLSVLMLERSRIRTSQDPVSRIPSLPI